MFNYYLLKSRGIEVPLEVGPEHPELCQFLIQMCHHMVGMGTSFDEVPLPSELGGHSRQQFKHLILGTQLSGCRYPRLVLVCDGMLDLPG